MKMRSIYQLEILKKILFTWGFVLYDVGGKYCDYTCKCKKPEY